MWTYQNFIGFIIIYCITYIIVSAITKRDEWDNRIKEIERGIK